MGSGPTSGANKAVQRFSVKGTNQEWKNLTRWATNLLINRVKFIEGQIETLFILLDGQSSQLEFNLKMCKT